LNAGANALAYPDSIATALSDSPAAGISRRDAQKLGAPMSELRDQPCASATSRAAAPTATVVVRTAHPLSRQAGVIRGASLLGSSGH
jgi:hypothetical protein